MICRWYWASVNISRARSLERARSFVSATKEARVIAIVWDLN